MTASFAMLAPHYLFTDYDTKDIFCQEENKKNPQTSGDFLDPNVVPVRKNLRM